MKNFIFLSGADCSDNKEALNYIHKTYPKFKRLLYIPSQKEGALEEIKLAKRALKKRDIKLTACCLESEKTASIKEKIKTSQILFLGGGNTFSFMNDLRRHGLKGDFKAHLKAGRLIVGLSAGAILMTPSMLMACYPTKDADECSNPNASMKGLGLVPFEICPHYKNSKTMNKDLEIYSSLHNNLVYAVKDGAFLAVKGTSMHFSEHASLFTNGRKINLT